jgi:bifunctional DNA-binding transcriptional regulator/antitoxin component of YhaV-PrlF toxin-antitoxin module
MSEYVRMASHETSDIIDRIAAGLGVKAETRRMWRRRGKVPGRWQVPILEQARRENVALEPDALDNLGPPGRSARARRPHEDRHLTLKTESSHDSARPAWVEIDARGRLPIPSPMLGALGVRPGDRVMVEIEDNDLRIRNVLAVVAEVQAFVRSFVPDDVSLVDELIAERRREAERD